MPASTPSLSQNLARHYQLKYGAQVAKKLDEAARIFEQNGDLHSRNRMLRLKDELPFLPPADIRTGTS